MFYSLRLATFLFLVFNPLLHANNPSITPIQEEDYDDDEEDEDVLILEEDFDEDEPQN